jgi:hypothetical protein
MGRPTTILAHWRNPPPPPAQPTMSPSLRHWQPGPTGQLPSARPVFHPLRALHLSLLRGPAVSLFASVARLARVRSVGWARVVSGYPTTSPTMAGAPRRPGAQLLRVAHDLALI